jgi:hypothetical protein
LLLPRHPGDLRAWRELQVPDLLEEFVERDLDLQAR